MRGEQFDKIVTILNSLDKRFSILVDQFILVRQKLESLEAKTLVVSDVEKELNKLKLDIKSLIDEKEA